ncbi:hypothetical protein K456DRAFT_1009346 [Colletotrichum gloeosporioides 23]|nr:hypothetical protein K456DRAFT_1009346 [Colletotrichum gloeosporioides 23]
MRLAANDQVAVLRSCPRTHRIGQKIETECLSYEHCSISICDCSRSCIGFFFFVNVTHVLVMFGPPRCLLLAASRYCMSCFERRVLGEFDVPVDSGGGQQRDMDRCPAFGFLDVGLVYPHCRSLIVSLIKGEGLICSLAEFRCDIFASSLCVSSMRSFIEVGSVEVLLLFGPVGWFYPISSCVRKACYLAPLGHLVTFRGQAVSIL